jgi:transposase-like protein
MIRREKATNKQQIISEYLTGGETFAALSKKYGVNARTIQTWVRVYRKRQPEPGVIHEQADVKLLQKRLEQAELKNELLEEMLRLSEEQTGIDLRKKFGTRQ